MATRKRELHADLGDAHRAADEARLAELRTMPAVVVEGAAPSPPAGLKCRGWNA